MESMETLKRRIGTAGELHSLVRTMKVLAAVNIRQLESSVASLADYNRAIELGLRVVLGSDAAQIHRGRRTQSLDHGVVIFGTDQGMCGSLNDQIIDYAVEQLASGDPGTAPDAVLAIGTRLEPRLAETNMPAEDVVSMPGSTAGITSLVQELTIHIERWGSQRKIGRVTVFHCQHTSRSGYRLRNFQLLPIDQTWLDELRKDPWPTHVLPTFTMPAGDLFAALVRQYLFVSLYRACAESMASENASRLAAMRGAEQNIGERIRELTTHFHQLRQMTITEELLDIATGFEALEQP